MLLSHNETMFSGTATSSSNTQADPIVTKYAQEAIFYLDVTAVSGTNPTLDVTINVYDSVTDKWYLLATFDQVTSVLADVGYVQYGLDKNISCSYAIGGTNTPTFTFEVVVNLKEPT